MNTNATVRWFGPHFAQLHPLLQQLHRDGGTLHGEVRINSGTGIAGWFGRRIAKRLGIPIDRPQRGFSVEIAHDDQTMSWTRTFDNGRVLRSLFRPVGSYDDGSWQETTGAVQFRLGVDIVQGGWHWRLRDVHVRGVSLPRWWFPRTTACKTIDDQGRYRFIVAFALPLIGEVLRYEGALLAPV